MVLKKELGVTNVRIIPKTIISILIFLFLAICIFNTIAADIRINNETSGGIKGAQSGGYDTIYL
ncbi:hypothetical protein ALNOE001_01240 [Candidatus Methanobinarius endosymbioticus]|uniref:Uncharacterized protein n=1 Tax=Candidatus Methanobinarius endosymbioticus TaxID=2006182 RepID=A0A366MEK5_9EURY|nr:hypothetical protein ALNOE001_01240 [Candidatus Methanobinarius endosymbioticus]